MRPGIGLKELGAAQDLLDQGDTDVVFGPVNDGGYYLVALRKARDLGWLKRLFDGTKIDWGTEKVLGQQVDVANALGLRDGVLDSRLGDVDLGEDLPTFEAETGTRVGALLKPRTSVVVCARNEAATISQTLEAIGQAATFAAQLEVVLADGGSTDATVAAARSAAANFLEPLGVAFQVVAAGGGRGRGHALNIGAKRATGDYLIFLHADTRLPQGFDKTAVAVLMTPEVSIGAYRFGLDCLRGDRKNELGRFFRAQMGWLEWGTNIRASRFELPYGDQALFVRRKTFDRVQGFRADHPLMEDVDFVWRCRELGRVEIAVSTAVTSARRWVEHGYLRVTLANSLYLAAYAWGLATPETLYRLYYYSN